jgi:hypothetical protein
MLPKKYIVDSKMFEYDRHYRECIQNTHPFIKARVNPADRKYHVQIDLMPSRHIFSKEGKIHLKKLFENEINCQKSDTNTHPASDCYSINEEFSWVDGVSPTRLNSLCENLYELYQKYHD